MFSAELKKEGSRAICRPDASCWVLVIMSVAFSTLLLTLRSKGPHAPSETELIILIGVLFLAPSLWLAIWRLRARIEANENGLRWRSMSRWHKAAWADVTDYYERFLPKGKKKAIIETRDGRVKFAGGIWKDSPALRTCVERNAVHARARAWGALGLRPELDWPRTFHYNATDNRFMAVMLPALALLLSVQAFSGWRSNIFSLWTVGALLLGYSPMLMLILLVLVPRLQDTKKRKMQSIAVSREGIEFRDGPRTVAMTWADITAYRTIRIGVAYRCIVETQHEAIDFSPAISEFAILFKAVEQNATAAHQSGWQTPDEQSLGGRAARWSGGCEGVGEHVFHYRTRTNRALLWLPTALLIATSLLAASGLTHPDRPFFSVIGILTFWGWIRYFRASVRIGDGLTQYTIFGPRRLAWSEIDDFYLSGDDSFKFGNVVGAGKRIRSWIGINEVQELKQEIAHHAVHSRNHTWELRQKVNSKVQTLTR